MQELNDFILEHIEYSKASILERLKLNNDSKIKKIYNHFPKTFEDLDTIISLKEKNLPNTNYVLDCRDIDISEMPTLYSCFKHSRAQVINISTWKINEDINSIDKMFAFCSSLNKIIGIENIDVSNVHSCSEMFIGCNNLTSLDLSKWNTKNVENMEEMFTDCNKLTEIKGIENFITDNVNTLNNMFARCYQLKEIDLSNWNVDKCDYFYRMFASCYQLESLGDISNWKIKSNADLTEMFKNCKNLKYIGDINKWKIHQCDTEYMFDECDKSIIPSWYEKH